MTTINLNTMSISEFRHWLQNEEITLDQLEDLLIKVADLEKKKLVQAAIQQLKDQISAKKRMGEKPDISPPSSSSCSKGP